MKKISIVASLALAGALSFSIIGCGSSSSPTSTTGTVSDGYVSGAKVFIDNNNNGNYNVGEPMAITQSDGHFTFSNSELNSSANVIAMGGIDIATGESIKKLTLPAGSPTFNVTPVTNMIAQVIASAKTAKKSITIDQAAKKVATFLGLGDVSTNVLFDDPAKSFNEATKATLLASVAKNDFNPTTVVNETNVTASPTALSYKKIINEIPSDVDVKQAEVAFKAVADANKPDANISTVIKKVKQVTEQAKDNNETIAPGALITHLSTALKSDVNLTNFDVNNTIKSAKAYVVKSIQVGDINITNSNGSFPKVNVKVDDDSTYDLFSNIKINLDKDSFKGISGNYDMNATINVLDNKGGKSIKVLVAGIKVNNSDGNVSSDLDGATIAVTNNGLGGLTDISNGKTVSAQISGISPNTDLQFNINTIINSLSSNKTKISQTLEDLNTYLRKDRSYTVGITLTTDMPLDTKAIVGTVEVKNTTASSGQEASNSNPSAIAYDSSLTNFAMNATLHEAEGNITTNGISYIFKVKTDTNAPTKTGQSITLYDKDFNKSISINNNYSAGTKVQIGIYSNDKLVGVSDIYTLTNDDLSNGYAKVPNFNLP